MRARLLLWARSCFCLKNCVNSASLTENSFVCTGGKPAAQVGPGALWLKLLQ
jgi:hypothetical protein